MAGPDFLSQLPSLEELLEQPRVKAAVERLNQSTAAARVRSAISGLGAEVAKRAEELQAMAPGDLLDKLVRRISEPTPPVAATHINATGRLFDSTWLGAPLPATAIEAMHGTAAVYRANVRREAATVAKRVLGCESATAFSSPVAGLGAAFEALASGGRVVVSRAEMREVSQGVRLDAICRRAGTTLHEVGATDSATLEDYEQALHAAKSAGPERFIVLKRVSEPGDTSKEVSLSDLSNLAHRHGTICLVDGDSACPREDTPAYGSSMPSLQGILNAGADAVLVRTAGRIGGPQGAMLVGKGSVVDAIANSQAAMADAVDPSLDAALAATLSLFKQPDTLRFTHPLYQLLDTPIENLRSRAERLAPQIAAGDGVAEATAEALEGRGGCPPSWRVRVVPRGDVETLARSLAASDTHLAHGTDSDCLTLDLRTVFPGQDRAIAAAFAPDLEENPTV